jgi:cell division protein FtsI (penicillin-binding protein 3)
MTSRESAGRRAARPAGRTGSPGQQARPRPGARPVAKRKATRTPKGVPFRIFAGVVVFFSIFLVVKLVQVQVVDGATYSHDEASEVRANVVLPASRGAIYDRAGDLLAASAPRYDVIADDMLIEDPSGAAAALAPLLGISQAKITTELSEKSDGYVVLAKQVTSATETAIARLNIEAITFAGDSTRVAPGGELFQPILGSVNAAGQGYSSLEYEFNDVLNGVNGREVVAEDPAGSQLPSAAQDIVPAKQGQSLILTLDEPLQNEVTHDVKTQMAATGADSGVAVIEDVQTGDILAMVDLVRGAKGVIGPAASNLALTSIYQPGSVMKLATIAYALQDHVISPDTDFVVPYSLNIGGYTFADADFHPTEILSAKQILAQSSNIGVIKISRLLGLPRLAEAFKALGFGQTTGLDWPGESPGIVGTPSSWLGSTAAAVPIGTGVAVTPMQILDAYNSVANGGVFVEPRLVSATVDAAGAEHQVPLAPTRRSLEASTVAKLVPMLEGVVCDENGTALLARIPGYEVAGKTGTAQVPNPNGPGSVLGDWNASFVGFVPAQAPKLSGIVVLNHPTPIYGGTVSAPVFSEIMQYALRHFDIPPPTEVSASVANSRPTTSSLACTPGT